MFEFGSDSLSMKFAGDVALIRQGISAMHQPLRSYSLVPDGFVVVTAVHDTAMTTITVRSSKDSGVCPSCGTVSGRVHSRYQRRVCDLPLSGRSVQLLVMARRFRCDAVLCGRQTFAERFANDVVTPWARRTARLDCIVHHLGSALGGRPAASFSQRLMLPVSNDTLLRVVRRRARMPRDPSTSSVLMIGPGAAIIATERLSAISNGVGW